MFDVMKTSFSFGTNQSLSIDLSDDSRMVDSGSPRGTTLDDPAAAVAAALDSPIDFPSMAKAIMPGDHVAVAIGQGIPQVAEVVAGVMHAILSGECEPSQITIVLPVEESREVARLLPEEAGIPIEVVRHDPNDTKQMSYLAASHEGHAIYMNRSLADADLVLPIGCLRPQASIDYWGMSGSLFPTFSDAASLDRYQALSSIDTAVLRQRRREEADEAAWLLGVQLLLQVIPGPGDSIEQVLAGERGAMENQGQAMCDAAWRWEAPQRAGVVVAMLDGGPLEQSWIHLARAARAAADCVEENGIIILCSSLDIRPSRSVLGLGSCESLSEAISELRCEHSAEAIVAGTLAHVMEGAHLYLLSDLKRETVEGLGMAHVASTDEVQRLVQKQASCILLRNAARLHICVAGEIEEKADAAFTR